MIDLDKNDSQESQGSYRAKNSKEIKELKRSNKRLASENRRLKSELNHAVHSSEKKIKEHDEMSIMFIAKLSIVLMLGFMFFILIAGKNLREYERAGEQAITLYNQCVDSKNSDVTNNDILSEASGTNFESQASKYITTNDIALHTFDKEDSDKAVNKLVELQKEQTDSLIRHIRHDIYNLFVDPK
ncbi:hypothetical protein [Pseudomonas putida]|uniref:hypothetical protein n=1 Tax=Pseudomonas putida TaxID=303 RepID=UPI000B301E00|nr:hypothetical protein [Pseudomonas putida]